MLNKIVLMGRLTRDPEIKTTPQGTKVAEFTLAVDRDYGGKEKKTDFFSVTAWRNSAEFAEKYFSKGMLVAVSGRLQQDRWSDKEDKLQSRIFVTADNVYPCERRNQQAQPQYQSGFEQIDDDDGDVPF